MAITTNQRNAASTSAVDKAAYAPTSTETVRNILLAYIAENGGVDLTAPGPIGATTPGTGAFTTVTASGELTLGTSGILNGGTNLIEQRNDTNAQAFRIYNTTNAGTTNYERLELGSTAVGSNTFAVCTSKGGTGTNRALYLGTLGAASTILMTAGTSRWAVDINGHFLAMADNTFDIGASGATRPRNVFVAGNGTFGGTLTTSVAGAASTPAVSVTGAPYTAGSATTNYPLIYANGGTAPTTWSTAGTYFGINAVSGFAGNLIDLRVNGGASVFKVSNGGVVTCTSVTASGVFVATPNTLTGAGAIGVSTTSTGYISTGAAQALTLADGVNGQIKTIIHTSDGGSGVLTPTTKAGYTTITFTNVGDSVTLQFIAGTGWCITGIYGAVAA